MENVTVIDRKPVGGDETAIQSYLDLSLDKNDIVEAVMVGATAKLNEEKVEVQKELDLIGHEIDRLRVESKDWIKKRAEAELGDKIKALKKLFGTEGSWRYQSAHSVLNGCYYVAEFRIDVPYGDVSLEYKIRNENDSQHSLAIDRLIDTRIPLFARMTRIDKEIDRIMAGTKTVRLQMATAILGRTEQGKQLLKAMTVEKLANAATRELAEAGQAKANAKTKPVGRRTKR